MSLATLDLCSPSERAKYCHVLISSGRHSDYGGAPEPSRVTQL
jgi:hypothetical protein